MALLIDGDKLVHKVETAVTFAPNDVSLVLPSSPKPELDPNGYRGSLGGINFELFTAEGSFSKRRLIYVNTHRYAFEARTLESFLRDFHASDYKITTRAEMEVYVMLCIFKDGYEEIDLNTVDD